jgi:hypothetical protein
MGRVVREGTLTSSGSSDGPGQRHGRLPATIDTGILTIMKANAGYFYHR